MIIDSNAKHVVRKAKRWIKEQIVEDVPACDALCEFYCRKGQCRIGEWESCERRLKDLQDFRNWERRKSDCDQLSLSGDRNNEAVSNGSTGKRDSPKPGKQPANPVHDPGTGKRQGDPEGRILRRVAAKTKSKQ